MDKKKFWKESIPVFMLFICLIVPTILIIFDKREIWPLLIPEIFMFGGCLTNAVQVSKIEKEIGERFTIRIPIMWLLVGFGMAFLCFSLYLSIGLWGAEMEDRISGGICLGICGLLVIFVGFISNKDKIEVDGLNFIHTSISGKIKSYNFNDIETIFDNAGSISLLIKNQKKVLNIFKIHKAKANYFLIKGRQLNIEIVHTQKFNKKN